MDLSQSFRKKPKKCGKFFSPHILLFDLKLDHNSALHAKIREKSLVIVRRLLWPLGRVKCGKGGGNGIRRGENALQNPE